jgi:hypothetical protein
MHQILGWPFRREFGQPSDVAIAKKTKRRRQRIDTLIDALVWLRKKAKKGPLEGSGL